MLRGFGSMARLLGLTLGPVGGNVVNDRDQSTPEILDDAATIARRIIQFPDRAEDAGAMMMRHIVWRVREEVGDGSATTAVMAHRLAEEMQRMIAAGANAMMLRRGIDQAAKVALKALAELSVPLEGEEHIAAVATAAIGDPEIGKILGEIYDVLGPNASITIEPYIATYHDRTYHDGARFRGGFVSPYFETDKTRHQAVLESPYVLVADMNFESIESVANLLGEVVKAGGKSLVVICRMMSDRGIGVMVANNEAETVQSCAADLKPVGDLRRGTMEDIAILTGGVALTDKTMLGPEELTIKDCGRADRVIVTKKSITIIGGHGDKAVIRDRMIKLRQGLRETTDKELRADLRDMVTHFSAGIGELRIGALTAKERTALTELAEQAMKAVQAGMEGGVVAGGGAAYLACIPAVEALVLEGDEAMGVKALARALEEPMRRIAANAGVHPPVAVGHARQHGPGYGFEVRSKKIVDMAAAGIVDPTLVATRALEQAISGAVMLLTTDALVLHRNPKESYEP
jgi:chaperonin GroEL